MKFVISGKNIEITDNLRDTIEEKLGKLDRYFASDTTVNVTLSVEKERQKIEVTIPVKGSIIRSEQVSNDMYVSIDLVEEVIERQLNRQTSVRRRFPAGVYRSGLRSGRGRPDHPLQEVRHHAALSGGRVCTDGTSGS